MNEDQTSQLTAIDQIANGDGLQMFKACIPYLPVSIQKSLTLYIKMQEMQNLLSFFQAPMRAASITQDNLKPEEILEEICSYGTPEQKNLIEQAMNLLNAAKLYQNINDMN